jgi:hypothetical protein
VPAQLGRVLCFGASRLARNGRDWHRCSQRGPSWPPYVRLLERLPLSTPAIRKPAASAHV